MNDPILAFGVEPSRSRYRLRLARYPAMAETVREFVNRRPAQERLDLLDIGVGSGRSLRYLEKEGIAGRINLHGVDISPRRLDQVYGAERWQLERGDVEKGLPYPAERFDILLCEQILEHLRRPDLALAEMARVLRPGGLAVIGVPIFPPPVVWGRNFFLRRVAPRMGGSRSSHLQTFSHHSILRLIAASGKLRVAGARGFRIISGGPLQPLENYAWWYRLNRQVGRLLPSACIEIQVIAYRSDDSQPPPAGGRKKV